VSAAFSDANLQRVIEPFGLYRRTGAQPESAEAVRRFRQDIGVTLTSPTTAGGVFHHEAAGNDQNAGDGPRVSERLAALLVETGDCAAEPDIPVWSMAAPCASE
jgi:hypothetical protein